MDLEARVMGLIDEGTADFKCRRAMSPYSVSKLYLGVYIAWNNKERKGTILSKEVGGGKETVGL